MENQGLGFSWRKEKIGNSWIIVEQSSLQVEVEEMEMPCSSSNVTLIEEGKRVNSCLELYHHQILFHFAGKKGPFL